MQHEANPPSPELERLEIELLLEGIYRRYGYDFREYAFPTIRRRVLRRLSAERMPSVTALLDKVLRDPDCMRKLVADFSIHVTEMFRDPPFFRAFRETVVPMLRTYPSVRIWIAGCSTGEEVYSLAILLMEEDLYEKTTIYATDISARVLRIAKSGVFPLERMRKYTANYIQSGGRSAFSDYYSVQDGKVNFRPELAKHIVFAQHNLATDGSFNEFHVIFCRNVLIYFNSSLQQKVYDLLFGSLGLFGILGLGDKESLAFTKYADHFVEVAPGRRLYRKIRE